MAFAKGDKIVTKRHSSQSGFRKDHHGEVTGVDGNGRVTVQLDGRSRNIKFTAEDAQEYLRRVS